MKSVPIPHWASAKTRILLMLWLRLAVVEALVVVVVAFDAQPSTPNQ
jgi:hypothetical protein